MSHLSLEALARLVDEAPTAADAEHLGSCTLCSAELSAMREEVGGLRDLPDLLPPPPGAWPSLESRLRREGLIRSEPSGAGHSGVGRLLRLAAGITLFLIGGASGFALRARLPQGPAGLAAASGAPAATAGEAARSLREAEAAYVAALARYAELSADSPATDPVARLAALEDILLTTGEALDAAPADPVINGYHLTALAQREAAVRQIALASDNRWY